MPIKNKWLWLFLLLTLVALLNIGTIATDELANGYKVDWFRYIINELSGAWLVLPLLPGLLWFFKKYPIGKENFWSSIPLHLLMTMAFSLVHTSLMYIVRTPLYQWFDFGPYSEWYGILEYRLVMEYFKQFIFYWVLYGGYLFLEKLRENQQQQIRAAQLEEQLTKARLQSLKMQLNPHFLFNTLNAISSMMYEDLDDADKMMAILSDMLRSTLNIQVEIHSVADELLLLDRYIQIMKIRFKDKLETKLIVEEEAKVAMIPVFLLQPLIENAIKYGVEAKGFIKVELHAKVTDQKLAIKVEDNGPGMQKHSPKGIGWSNTLERLEKLFGEDFLFKLKNKPEGGLQVEVEIPIIHEEV